MLNALYTLLTRLSHKFLRHLLESCSKMQKGAPAEIRFFRKV